MVHVLRRFVPRLGLFIAAALAVLRPTPGRASDMPPMPQASDSSLTLDWLEKTALERNPSLSAMREAVREARSGAERAGGLEDPMLEAMAAPQSFDASSVQPAYRLGVTQHFPLFGERGLRRRAATAHGDVVANDFATARLDLLRDVRNAYYDYYRACRGQDTNREQVKLMNQFRSVALARYAAGAVGEADPLQAETELAMLEHQAVSVRQRRHVIAARLRALLHLPQDRALSEPPRDLPLPEAPDTAEWLAARSRAAWPELAAADARVAARQAELTLAHRERLPETTVGVAYDRFWNEPELRTSVALSFNLPIYLGRLASAERAGRAALAMAEDERLAARDLVDQRIEEASAALGESLHDVEITREQLVPASERSLHAVRVAYEANRTDFLTLLNAARDLERARFGLYESLAMAHQAQAELRRALALDTPARGSEGER